MNRWMPAFEAQLQGINLLDRCLRDPNAMNRYKNLQAGFNTDVALMRRATPFYWSWNVMEAVHMAADRIPYETTLDRWNLDCESAWWYFEKPMPINTTTSNADLGIRGLCMGWAHTEQTHSGTGEKRVAPTFWVSVWVDTTDIGVCASQTFMWTEGETIDDMIRRLAMEYSKNYGPTGPFASENNTIGVERYVIISTFLTKFILAGLAWLGQKIVTQTDGNIERHRRKEFKRIVGRDTSLVKVIELRKRERQSRPANDGSAEIEESTREYTHRWLVDGHWRNQPVGTGRLERRLTYIHPYIKGPDDRPFLTKEKVYVVDR